MRLRTTRKMMPPHNAGEATSFADADYIDEFLAVKNINQNAVAGLDVAVGSGLGFFVNLDWHFARKLDRRQVVLSEMPLHRLGKTRFLHEFNQANLRGRVAVFGLGLVLRDDARASLQNRRRMNVTLVIEELRHADFFSENSSYFCHFPFSPFIQRGCLLLAGVGLNLTTNDERPTTTYVLYQTP